MFALPISKLRFKMKLFLQKNAKFSKQKKNTPKTAPPIANFWLRACKEHPQMDLSSSINARQLVMRCPIRCFRSRTVCFFFLHMTVLQFDLLFMPSRY